MVEKIYRVLLRLNSFLFELFKNVDGTTVVMTHNVVLRCLIGQAHNIPRQKWHLLSIPHAEPLEFKVMSSRFISNIPRKQLGKIFSKLCEV